MRSWQPKHLVSVPAGKNVCAAVAVVEAVVAIVVAPPAVSRSRAILGFVAVMPLLAMIAAAAAGEEREKTQTLQGKNEKKTAKVRRR